ncbi:MAG: radical SAM protein [Dysosmobacter sp.]
MRRSIRGLFAAREAHPAACVDTFGCQQNVADGQKLMGMLEASGFTLTQDPKEADLVLLNTCAIREHAEDRVFGNLGALTHTKKENPEQIICLCGCMAQEPRVSERIKKSYPHVDLVFGPQALWKFPELLWQVYETKKRVFSVQDEHGTIAEGIPVVREKGVKAWVSIMYGCNNFCSYCIVPYVRGRERSRDPQAVLAEVRQLVEAGLQGHHPAGPERELLRQRSGFGLPLPRPAGGHRPDPGRISHPLHVQPPQGRHAPAV